MSRVKNFREVTSDVRASLKRKREEDQSSGPVQQEDFEGCWSCYVSSRLDILEEKVKAITREVERLTKEVEQIIKGKPEKKRKTGVKCIKIKPIPEKLDRRFELQLAADAFLAPLLSPLHDTPTSSPRGERHVTHIHNVNTFLLKTKEPEEERQRGRGSK